MVDCLLPGQIRQLGGAVTYLSAPRAVKTSAGDCELRGGEYVAYDRANYATALKVWLPLAEKGDTKAQTYVGEIFEKGLGVPADHAAAAQWYRRAAEGGSSNAAINLGFLYERGLGVPKDPVQALGWYRRAAGVSDLRFDVAAPGSSTTETQQLRQEVAELRRQLQAKQSELERTQRELDTLRQRLEQGRTEVDTERAALARLRQELSAKRPKDQAESGRVRDLERAILDREAKLAGKDRELADLRAAIARRDAEAQAQRAEVERLQKTTADGGPEIQLIEPELIVRRDIQVMRAQATADRVPVIGRVVASAGLLSLTVNGQEEKLVANNVFKTQIAIQKPEERVRIAAVDKAGRKATLEFVIVDRGAAKAAGGAGAQQQAERVGWPSREKVPFGNYYALVIGNNDYTMLPKLQTAVNDARQVAAILEKDYRFRVKLLINAKRYDVLSAMNELRERLTDKDNLLVYYAGHGELDQKNQRGHWLPIDAEPKSSANWISNIQISDVLNAMAAQQLLVVADSCYAGTFTRSALGQLEPGMTEQERMRVIRLMAQRRSRMVMTSGGVEPVLDGSGGPHSVFAQTFIELLQKNVGVLPGQEMFNLLRLRVAAAAAQLDTRQVPEYAPIKFAGHDSGDFVFVRGN